MMTLRRGTMATLVSAIAIATLLLTMALVSPVLGGVPVCSLQATVGGGSATEVETGEEVLIEGFGFPPNADVEITLSLDGTPFGSGGFIADPAGMFETTLIPQPGEEGTWTVTATVVKGCTAETGFLVIAGATPTPSPTPAPTATPAPTPKGELPNVATRPPDGPNALILAGLFVLSASVWLSHRRLARQVR
jgi:hypothetical protein